MKEKIAEVIKQRQIESLYHFTRAENLQNICKWGLVPREVLDRQQIESIYNDEYRYDNCLSAICTSIEFPNYKMFYKLRIDNPKTDWVVLRLPASILYEIPCAFCWTNAGDFTMYSETLEQRMSADAFLNMFGDKPGYPQRQNLNISDCYPTNPQAEVLVLGIIPVGYIQNVYFENIEALNKYKVCIPEWILKSVNQNPFAPRMDWQAW